MSDNVTQDTARVPGLPIRTAQSTASSRSSTEGITACPFKHKVSQGMNSRDVPDNEAYQALQAELHIERLLGLRPTTRVSRKPCDEFASLIPDGFRKEIILRRTMGEFDQPVASYHLATLSRGDSPRLSHPGSSPSPLQALLAEDMDAIDRENIDGYGWKPVRSIGKGSYATVLLWQKTRKDKALLRLAVKETVPSKFFRDYCSEAQLTRRLNNTGCKNVIRVVDWLYLSKPIPRQRICYEYAEYSDLRNLELWYRAHELVVPEAFIWHIFHGIVNALCYCRRGANNAQTPQEWDTIVHGDIKQENIFLTTPDPDDNRLYPRVMLADFGLSYTLPRSTPAVQHWRSSTPYGTDGYMAPEVEDQSPEKRGRRRAPHELHGSHSDIYSLGKSLDWIVEQVPNYRTPSPSSYDQQTKIPMKNLLASVYTPTLVQTLAECTSPDSRDRPKTYPLWQLTRREMLANREKSYAEAEAAVGSEGMDKGCFRSSVLFTPAQHHRYEHDPEFRERYRKANLAPLEDVRRKSSEWGRVLVAANVSQEEQAGEGSSQHKRGRGGSPQHHVGKEKWTKVRTVVKKVLAV